MLLSVVISAVYLLFVITVRPLMVNRKQSQLARILIDVYYAINFMLNGLVVFVTFIQVYLCCMSSDVISCVNGNADPLIAHAFRYVQVSCGALEAQVTCNTLD